MRWYSKLLWLAGILVIGIVLYRFNPSYYVLMPKCPFKILTGLSCPGCGFQRAMHALLHGRVLEAVNYNLFLVFAGPYAFFIGVNQWLIPKPYSLHVSKIIEHRVLVYLYVIMFFYGL